MRVDLQSLRSSILAAIGAAGATACGGLVVFVDDGGGGDDGQGGQTSSNVTNGSTSQSVGGAGGGSPCQGAQPVVGPDGSNTGYVKCADGSIDRESLGQCAFDWDPPSCLGNEDFLDCTSDADCAPGGQCGHTKAIKGGTWCQCFYGCEVDEDCGDSGLACACGGMLPNLPGSMCVQPSCITNADCPSGECGLGTYDDGCGRQTFLACRSELDQCRTDLDCGGAAECSPRFAGGAFECVVPSCDIGRPLVVDGRARTAQAVARSDWSGDAPPGELSLSPAQRAAAALRYREIAAMEHASVASFSRFALQLLAVGAPADLLTATHQAALDEVRHAELAFSLASTLSGQPHGPGPLPEAAAPLRRDLISIVEALVHEACVGETLGAAEAALGARSASPRWLKGALEQVALDEQRHAELGWRALAWLLRGHPGLREVARQAFEQAESTHAAALPDELPCAPAAGLPAPRDVVAVRRATLAGVVRPCAQALLAEPRGHVSP